MRTTHVNKHSYRRVRRSLLIRNRCQAVTLQKALQELWHHIKGVNMNSNPAEGIKVRQHKRWYKMWRRGAGFSCCDGSKLGAHVATITLRGASIREPLQRLPAFGETDWSYCKKKSSFQEASHAKSCSCQPNLHLNMSPLSAHFLLPASMSASGLLRDTQSLPKDFKRHISKVLVLTYTHPQIISQLWQIKTICALNPPPGYSCAAAKRFL